MTKAFLTGFFTGFSLILAIGAQNAFVLRQGLKGEHVFWLCLFCSVSDAILIALGVTGFGAIVAQWPNLPTYMAYAGAAFLIVYGLSRLKTAWIGEYEMSLNGTSQSLAKTIAIVAAFTWANPHVYLDTVGLIGAISTSFAADVRLVFAIGAMLASFVFFFSLGYGAKFLAPLIQSAKAWRFLDIGIAVIMFWLALTLIYNAWNGLLHV